MSDSTVGHVDAMVARVRSYTSPVTGKTVARLCAGRVYNAHGGKYQDPESAAFPHVVLRKVNAQGDDHGLERFEVEALVHHQGRNKGADCEEIADLVEQAMLTWKESSAAAGLSVGRVAARDTLPINTGPGVLPNVITVRILITATGFPRRLTLAVA